MCCPRQPPPPPPGEHLWAASRPEGAQEQGSRLLWEAAAPRCPGSLVGSSSCSGVCWSIRCSWRGCPLGLVWTPLPPTWQVLALSGHCGLVGWVLEGTNHGALHLKARFQSCWPTPTHGSPLTPPAQARHTRRPPPLCSCVFCGGEGHQHKTGQ